MIQLIKKQQQIKFIKYLKDKSCDLSFFNKFIKKGLTKLYVFNKMLITADKTAIKNILVINKMIKREW